MFTIASDRLRWPSAADACATATSSSSSSVAADGMPRRPRRRLPCRTPPAPRRAARPCSTRPARARPRESANRISLCQTAGVCSKSPSMIAMTRRLARHQPVDIAHRHAAADRPRRGSRAPRPPAGSAPETRTASRRALLLRCPLLGAPRDGPAAPARPEGARPAPPAPARRRARPAADVGAAWNRRRRRARTPTPRTASSSRATSPSNVSAASDRCASSATLRRRAGDLVPNRGQQLRIAIALIFVAEEIVPAARDVRQPRLHRLGQRPRQRHLRRQVATKPVMNPHRPHARRIRLLHDRAAIDRDPDVRGEIPRRHEHGGRRQTIDDLAAVGIANRRKIELPQRRVDPPQRLGVALDDLAQAVNDRLQNVVPGREPVGAAKQLDARARASRRS